MRFLFIALLCALVPLHASAQQLEVSWARTVEGANTPWTFHLQVGNNIAADAWGNVAVTSYDLGDDIQMQSSGQPLVVQQSANMVQEAFVGRYRNDGTPSWGFWIDSPAFNAPQGVDMDNEGNLYVALLFDGPADLDPSPDQYIISPADGDRDLAIVKYDSLGNFLNAIHLVNYQYDFGMEIKRMGFDAANNLYIAGYFENQMDLDPDTAEVLITGNGNAKCGFVAKYDPNGALLQYLVLRTSQNRSDVMDMVVEPNGAVGIVGNFTNTLDLDPGPGELNLEGATGFIAQYDSSFHPIRGRSFASGGIEQRVWLACKGFEGGMIIGGEFRGDLSITLTDGTVLTMDGGFNTASTFIAGLNADGDFRWFKKYATDDAVSTSFINGLTAKDDGSFYAQFSFSGDLDLNPGASSFTTNTGPWPNADVALARYTMDAGEFILGQGFPDGGEEINYNNIELVGSTMYMSAIYTNSMHPDIPATANVLSPGGLAIIKYCHVPEHVTTSALNNTLVLCPGADSLIIASGADRFLWYDTVVGGPPIGSGDTLQLVAWERSRTIYLEGINGSCASQRVAIEIVVRPQVQLSEEQLTICQGDTVLLGYSGLADSWTPSIPAAFSTGYVPNAYEAIWMEATDLNTGCTASDTAWVTVLPAPDLTLQLMPNSICLTDPLITLTGASLAGGSWEGAGIVNGSQWAPLESGPGTFPVSYTVTGTNGCTASATEFLTVALCTTGIFGGNSEHAVTLFPVPVGAGENLTLNGLQPGNLLSVSSVDGQHCSLEVEHHGTSTLLHTSALAPGTYVVRDTAGRAWKFVVAK